MYQLLRGACLEDEEITDGVLLLRVGIVDFFLISSPFEGGEEIEKVSDYMSRGWRSCRLLGSPGHVIRLLFGRFRMFLPMVSSLV